jgi:hypothetical protein
MLKAYQYIFYRLYSWCISNGEHSPIYAFATIFGLTWFNILTIMSIVEIQLNKRFDMIPQPILLAILLIFMYLQYLVLLRDKKYKQIVQVYSKYKFSKAIGNFLVWIYILCSVIGFVFTANIVREF